ncbi:MAG: immunoglobulin domain-containing protein [Candidatus Omnitrophica bacterium]|nr:immunoglobulin domain-containing protein [Candidatus Omnitrophota bacterium]
MRKITCISIIAAAGLVAVQAADLVPVATGNNVDTLVAGRTDLALATGGATAFASTAISGYEADLAIDGILNEDANPWIPLDGNTTGTDYLAVDFNQAVSLEGLVISGRFPDRSAGTYTFQYTTDASPITADSHWTDLGSYSWQGGAVMPRTAFAFAAVANATGIRIVTKSAAGLGDNIQEFEAYPPITTPPSIVTQPQGATVMEGDIVSLTVSATGAQGFQWRKDGVDIAGATGSTYTILDAKLSDAGSYQAVATNSLGSATSSAAVLAVTPAPTYASYKDAVMADQPIHYYPLDETNGTVAADLGSQNSGGGTYTGGITLGRDSVTPGMGKAAFFDGLDGTFVDLGLFHPGNSVTLEAWVNMASDASATYKAIVARWDGSYEMDTTGTDVGNLVIHNDSNAFGLVQTAKPLVRGQWYHIVSVFANGVLTIYLNGEQGTSQEIGGVLQDLGLNTPDRVLIGATRTGIFGWRGLITQVTIYDKGLTPGQIRAHYRAALPSAGPELTIEKAVLVTWPSFPPGYVLQGAPGLEEPANWNPITNNITSEGGINKAAVPAASGNNFFRLVKP